jgi:hypothetical protein
MIFVPLLDKDGRNRQARSITRSSRRASKNLRDKYEGQTRAHQDPRDRLRQADRRTDRRPVQQVMMFFGAAAVAICTASSSYNYTRCIRSTLLVIACSMVAVVWQLGLVRPRLRARSVLGPGAFPGVRHRREPRRPEDERHHAGRRPRHPPAGGGALHLPPPVPGRPDGAAGRRGGLCRADGDRHPGDPGPGHDRQPRRGRADLHQPAAAARAAVLHRRQRRGRAAQPAAKSARKHAARGWASILGRSRSLHRAQAGPA